MVVLFILFLIAVIMLDGMHGIPLKIWTVIKILFVSVGAYGLYRESGMREAMQGLASVFVIWLISFFVRRHIRKKDERSAFLFGVDYQSVGGVNLDGRKSGQQFEQDCARYLRKRGYINVRVTPASGDFGADITASDWRGNRYVFQCKYYTSKVGNSCVQEVIGAKAHYHANKAGVMTNGRLTDKARQLAWENDVILMEEILE